jgi:hypothetical protein
MFLLYLVFNLFRICESAKQYEVFGLDNENSNTDNNRSANDLLLSLLDLQEQDRKMVRRNWNEEYIKKLEFDFDNVVIDNNERLKFSDYFDKNDYDYNSKKNENRNNNLKLLLNDFERTSQVVAESLIVTRFSELVRDSFKGFNFLV